jgi:hypothetical protein
VQDAIAVHRKTAATVKTREKMPVIRRWHIACL